MLPILHVFMSHQLLFSCMQDICPLQLCIHDSVIAVIRGLLLCKDGKRSPRHSPNILGGVDGSRHAPSRAGAVWPQYTGRQALLSLEAPVRWDQSGWASGSDVITRPLRVKSCWAPQVSRVLQTAPPRFECCETSLQSFKLTGDYDNAPATRSHINLMALHDHPADPV